MEKQGVIYKIENLANGKVYVGQTVRKFERRVYEHKRELMKNIHNNCLLQNSWNKHKEESFIFSVVKKCNSSELDRLEVDLIAFYKEKNLSYNLEGGGNKGKIVNDITREKMKGSGSPNAKSVICVNTGEVFTSIAEASEAYDIPRQNICHCCIGRRKHAGQMQNGDYMVWVYEKDYDINKKHSFARQKIEEIKTSKKVICITTGEIFDSVGQAAKKMNTQQSKVSMCCNGKRKTSGKLEDGTPLKWRFLDTQIQ